MGAPYVIMLCEMKRLNGLRDFESLFDTKEINPVPSSKLIDALKKIPFMKSNSDDEKSTVFWGNELEEFEIPTGDVRSIEFIDVDALNEFMIVCHTLARELGPITIIQEDPDQRVEVLPSMTPVQLNQALNNSR